MASQARPVGRRATIYVIAIVALCVATALFVFAISALRPVEDNTLLIATVVGLNTTAVTALLALTVQEVHLAVNSRLTQLLALTAASERAKGKLDAEGRGDHA